MTSVVISTPKINAQLLKYLSRMYEAKVPLNDISKEMGMDEMTVKRLLQLLGYSS